MVQNKKKIIDLFTGNLANAVLHRILENAIEDETISNKYLKEVKNSWEIAKKYREKINPQNETLPQKYAKEIKNKIITRVTSELKTRISKGYQNLSLDSIEEQTKKALKELNII